MTTPQPTTVDAYIAGFPSAIQQLLQQIRAAVREAAPEAAETIKYAIPTYTLRGNLVHFAAYKHHIGFYPTPSGTDAFEAELSKYKRAKGSVQFPLDQPIPLNLISKIVKFRVQEQAAKPGKKR